MKTYIEDCKLVKKMRRKQRVRHPKWQKSRRLRTILWLISLTFTILLAVYAYFTLGGLLGSFFAGMGAFMLSAIPASIHTIAIAEESEDFIGRSTNQVIISDDTTVKHGYKSERDSFNEYTIDELKYTQIQRIVYNKYHERIDIYGNRIQMVYTNYKKGEVGETRGVKGKNAIMRIYLYYIDSDTLLENILLHTNIKLEVIDCPEI